MMYRISIDVTLTGELYIAAKNKEEAAKIAGGMYFSPYDCRNFRFLDVEIVDVEEEEAEE